MSTPETFNQFYARVFAAHNKAKLRACTDPVKRAALKTWHKRSKKMMKATWDSVQAERRLPQSSVTDQEQAERRAEYAQAPRERTDFTEHNTYGVTNGKAW